MISVILVENRLSSKNTSFWNKMLWASFNIQFYGISPTIGWPRHIDLRCNEKKCLQVCIIINANKVTKYLDFWCKRRKESLTRFHRLILFAFVVALSKDRAEESLWPMCTAKSIFRTEPWIKEITHLIWYVLLSPE